MAAPNTYTPVVAAAHASKEQRQGVRSSDAASIADMLFRASVPVRRAAIKPLDPGDLARVLTEVERETGTMTAPTTC
ncbi:hypothetical protein [Streptomyces sp. NPDC005507]|uniref:hypothetical protein n=1 Tax=Streptomyces sp. NPDC005507 TaxID=3154885 RepID=UPI0033AC2844